MNDVSLSGFRLCLHGDVDVLSNSDGWRQLGRLCSSNDSEESTVYHHLRRRLDILVRGLDASHELASTYCIMFSFRKPENYVKLSWPVGSLLTVQLGFANLVLAVIVRGQVLFQQS